MFDANNRTRTFSNTKSKDKDFNTTTKLRKIAITALVMSIATAVVLGMNQLQLTFAQNEGQENMTTTQEPVDGFNIHAAINRHDASDLGHKMDHYCKLDQTIVAVCQLYDEGKLAQIEFIITEAQYDQLPDKEKQNWHNHAVELTPQRGDPEFVSLPPGVNGTELLATLQTTYGKVITIWEPEEELPQSWPYPFMVDSPFALGQDKNDNLQNEWPVGETP